MALQGAMASQEKDSHKTCVEMCTTAKCKTACGAKQEETAAAKSKKGKLGLSKSDEDLLQKAQKQQKIEYLKACVRHCNGEAKCKAKCSASKSKGASAAKHSAAKGALKLPMSDMKLLADAQKRQNKETKEKKAMMKNDLAALGDHHADMSSSDELNHQPAMDGDGDWSKGMRSNAMKELGEEREQAKETAKIAAENDADDSWSS